LNAEDKIGPKESTYCQITLSEPVMALRNDHFIVRDETARKTLAGGIVIHPWARKHKRPEPDLRNPLESLHAGDATHLIESFLNESGDFALPIESIHQFLNLEEGACAQSWSRLIVSALSMQREKEFTRPTANGNG